MWKFMVVTFLLLGWGFYELSGGSDFQPPAPRGAAENALRSKVAAEEQALASRATQATEVVLTTEETLQPELVGLRTLEEAANGIVEEITSAAEAPVADAVVEEVAAAPTADIRAVTGDRVNMRAGPGTDFAVVTQLVRGDEAEVLQDPGNGWVEIQVLASGDVGWMADWLMAPVN